MISDWGSYQKVKQTIWTKIRGISTGFIVWNFYFSFLSIILLIPYFSSSLPQQHQAWVSVPFAEDKLGLRNLCDMHLVLIKVFLDFSCLWNKKKHIHSYCKVLCAYWFTTQKEYIFTWLWSFFKSIMEYFLLNIVAIMHSPAYKPHTAGNWGLWVN